MTVIRPNSISGVTSITAQASEINVFRSDGALAGLQLNGVNFNTTAGVSTFATLNATTVSIGGTFAANAVGVHTSKILGINTTTIAGSATSEGAIQVRGNLAIEEGLLTLDSNIHTSVSVPSGKNALLIGPTTVGAGATIDVAQGSTLVVV